jgi:predicted ATP-dependent endonuclease of OLD family
LDVRASDLLQSNGIIWVEGPSDRIYINKWINICEPNLHEGFHYMIMFYGGKLLSHLSFDDDWLNNEFIPLLKINTNSFVVIDKDRKRAGQKINDTKNRIESEIGEKNCWITKGIEIENYLNSQVIENWLRNKYQIAKKVDIDKFDKFEQSISNVSSIKYASKKNYFSREISEFITEESLNYLDLEPRLNQLITEIRKWNSI